MDKNQLARDSVDKMYSIDYFSQWLGIEREIIEPGRAVLKLKVKKEMLNGFGILHGGVTYSLADTALAFAANTYGKLSVPISTTMNYPARAELGDTLTAEAKELNLTNKTALYDVTVKNQDGTVVGIFRGTVYRTSKNILE
ncbi:MAG: hotdog fold thioesterase [Candidatus Kapaibacterium sp.]